MAIVSSNFKEAHSIKTINLNDEYFTSYFFQIPEYQRNYSWQNDQIEDFLSNIEILLNNPEEKDSKIYLGNIIVLEDSQEIRNFQILDGQQRLTTLFLSIKVLLNIFEKIISDPDINDFIKKETKKEFEEKFNKRIVETILISTPEIYELGVKGERTQRIIYKNAKENKKYMNILDNNYSDKNKFTDNYKMIKTSFEKLVFDKNDSKEHQLVNLLKLRYIILEKIIFDFTITKDISSAYSIFESLNTTGLLLTPYDIVSGKINSGSFESETKDYNAYCDSLIEKKYNITNLLHYYVQIRKKDVNVKKSDIVKYFSKITKNEIKKILNYFLVVEHFEENYPTLYKLISNGFNRKQLWPIIYGLGFYNEENNKGKIYDDDEIKFIKFLLMFSIYDLNILKHSPGGIYKRIINEYVNTILQNGLGDLKNFSKKMNEYLKDENNQVDMETAKKAMADIDINLKKSFLIYYLYINNSSSTLDIDKINLEHIYPQNPSPIWKDKGWKFKDEEEEENYTCSFGNLMLLNQKLNKSLSNKYIIDKKEKYEEFKDDALKNNDINYIDYDLFDKNKTSYILERENKIIEKLLNINELKYFINK